MTAGTVFDIGYRNYTGVREGRGRSIKAIYKDGVRIALGLGRGGKAKILPFAFLAILSGIALVLALIAGAADRLGGPGSAEKLDLPSHSDFYGIAAIIIFVFAAVVGPELLCRDKRDGVINLYLVRPLTGSDYVASRWLAFFTIMMIATLLPQTILFFGLSLGDPKPVEYLSKHWLDVPRYALSGVAMAAYATTLSMLTASFTSRRAYASVFLVGLFIITAPFTVGLSQELGGTVGQWISMFDLSNIPVHVNDIIFNDVSEMTEHAPARELPEWVRVAWYFLWTLGPATILWARYRRLSP